MTRAAPRLLVIGHGRAGKDTAAACLAAVLGLRWRSSSEFAAERAVWPLVAECGVWANWRAAYLDRHRHRDLWFHAIRAFNLRPGRSLAEELLDVAEIYVGMRARAEFVRSRHLFDLVIWVEAGDRVPPEAAGSMELTGADADLVLDNSGPEAALDAEVARIAGLIRAAALKKGPGGGVPGPSRDRLVSKQCAHIAHKRRPRKEKNALP